MTTFTATNHQNKSAPFIRALLDSGYELREVRQKVDLLLSDHDAPILGYRELIDWHRDNGAKILLTPHGANPNLQWDGIWRAQKVDGVIVPAEGHKQVMEAYGYPYPIHVVGWPWTRVNTPHSPDGLRVLFAPIHPDGEDNLPEPETRANAQVYAELLMMDIKLTVRYLGSLEANGLHTVAGVTFKRGVYDNGHADILHADVVVSSGTYAYHATALGVPSVHYWQQLGTAESKDGSPAHYAEYRSLLEYPLDALVMGTARAVGQARKWPPAALKWREQFIGQPFEVEKLLAVVDGLGMEPEVTADISMITGGM